MTGAYDPLSREDRVQIEGQIVQYQREITRLSYRLNQDVVFMRLSNELIAEIFMHCAAEWHSTPTPKNLKALRRWLPITIVCQHWRDVALGTPFLWASICVGMSNQLTSTFLERSSQAYLNVYGCLDLEDFYALPCGDAPYRDWQLLAQDAFRVRSVVVEVPAPNRPLIPPYTCIPPFSALRHLEIRSTTYFSRLSQLPSFLVSSENNLSSLKAHFVPLNIIRPVLKPSLRCLRLSRLRMEDLSWSVLSDTLRVLTGLEELELEGELPPFREHSTDPNLDLGRTVAFPRLRSLILAVELSYTAALLLPLILFPGEAVLTVKYGKEYAEGDTANRGRGRDRNGPASLALAVSRRLSGETALSPGPPIASLLVTYSKDRSCARILGFPGVVGQLDRISPENTTVAPTLVVQTHYDKCSALLAHLGSSSAFQGLIRLEIHECHFLLHNYEGHLHTAFAHLPSLSLVRAFDVCVEVILDAMLPEWHSESGVDDRCFPALEVLDIRECRLSTIAGKYSAAKAGVNILDQVLLSRPQKQEHQLLGELILRDCTDVDQESLDMLKSSVKQLTWDGRGLLSDDDDQE